MTATIAWFRRDLRVADQPALRAAVDEAGPGGEVVPLFVVDPRLLATGANRRHFLAGCLEELSGALGGRLALRAGPPELVVPRVAAEVGATRVFVTGDGTGFGRRRDAAVERALARVGASLVPVSSPYAVPPGRVRTGTGTPYRVFTPFLRAWLGHGWRPPQPAPDGARWLVPDPGPDGGPDDGPPAVLGPGDLLARPGDAPAEDLPVPGEPAGHRALEAFLDGPVEAYAALRDLPGTPGTSRLSPYLRFGCLHPRQVLARLGAGDGPAAFRGELAWREFAADVLWHRPDSAWRPLAPAGAHLRCDAGPVADERFARWSSGTTGFPLVDAGMRQLLAEGWMHNRVRMVAASFLVKDLHVDWRRGARWFLEHLVDGDVASNNHGWQWVAGTGTDAAPFHRVFNPEAQRARFDPDGGYVRRYVPEAGTAAYPPPMVDHGAERAEALARWEDARLAARAGGGGART